ncbi:MAG: hypothetical protein V5B44_17835 [Candidatus Accumulibacter necessarius]|uniref:hypothetical protein n=1 Tax=Candidatus Accumulibacter necessarius TaxID=2954386 RepID=UPI002FC343F7
MRRTASELPAPAAELSWCYQQLNPGEVDLGFAGRSGAGHPVHRRIAALSPDPLHLQQEDRRWLLRDAQGNLVGRNSPPATRHRPAWTASRRAWRRSSSATGATASPNTSHRIRCERWEVVLPELVFAPAQTAGIGSGHFTQENFVSQCGKAPASSCFAFD